MKQSIIPIFNAMEKAIVTGLLAFGMSGKVFHAPFIDAHPGFEFYAVLERNQKNAVNDYPAVKSFESFEDLISDPNIELVIINTPNYTHADYTRRSLQAGKHVLVEKPFTATSSEAKELFDLAKQLDKKIFVYQNRRFDSDFLVVKEIINSGKLGKLNELHIRYDRYRSAIGPKTFKEEPNPASGLSYDLGPHLLDQTISLFGKPLAHQKILANNREKTQVDDYFHIHLSYPNNIHVFLTASLLVADPQKAFVLHGTKGSFIKPRADVQEEQLLKGMKLTDPAYGIESEQNKGILTVIAEDGSTTKEEITSNTGSYLPIFEAVYQSIRNNEPYPIKEEDILTQLEILEH